MKNECHELISARVDPLEISWYDYDEYLKEKAVLSELRKPKVKEMKMPTVVVVELPKKKDPWANKREHALPKMPSNVSLPRKKIPWEK